MAVLKKDNAKLEQSFNELIQAFSSLTAQLEKKYEEDDEACSTAIIEAIGTVIESAIEESDVTTGSIAQMLAVFTEALEEIDPDAFESIVSDDSEDDDYDLDDDDTEEYNEDDDEEDDDDNDDDY